MLCIHIDLVWRLPMLVQSQYIIQHLKIKSMKKVMFIALSFLMMTGASAFAQGVVKTSVDSTKTTVSTTTTAKLVKEEIKSADLPQPVKDLGTNFKAQGWDTAEVAYSVKNETNEIVYYLVTFKNTKTGETKSVNIDAKGGIVNS